MGLAVFTQDLRKGFSTNKGFYQAVRGVNLSVKEGEIFGFLGPNGAGKTTTLKMLTTLTVPDSGSALVAGYDVKESAEQVRQRIGYVSQSGGADTGATGYENLLLQAQLCGLSEGDAKARAKEAIEILSLEDCADRMIPTYSGGQRRRLDIGLGIMHRPQVLFLDEPTTGLDPQNRANLWEQIKKLRNEGVTIFLTSHYLDEVDFLSDRLAIMDRGEIVAEGTSKELKKQIAGDVVTIGLRQSEKRALELLGKNAFVREISEEAEGLRLYVDNGEAALPLILRLLDREEIPLQTISLSTPSLDDVFLKKTGRSLNETTNGASS